MLLGAELQIDTDHKNILNVDDLSEQQLHWIFMWMNMVLLFII
jgi:hypothetical protein